MRWKALGLSMALCVFGATGCGYYDAPDAAAASPVKAKIEWRLASHAPTPEYVQADYHGKPVYLAPQALLVVDEAATVAPADNGDGQPALDLRFPGHGQRLTQATTGSGEDDVAKRQGHGVRRRVAKRSHFSRASPTRSPAFSLAKDRCLSGPPPPPGPASRR